MLRFVWRKMMNNKWMVLCLLTGVVLAVGMVTSIPMFTDGVLNRVLRRDLEQYQLKSRIFPGRLYYKVSLDTAYTEARRQEALNYFDYYMPEQAESIGLPVRGTTRLLTAASLRGSLPDAQPDKYGRVPRIPFKVGALDGFEDRISIMYGSMPAETMVDGAYEAIMSYSYMVKNDIKIGELYECVSFTAKQTEEKPIHIRVVGVYEINDSADVNWFDGGYSVSGMYMMNMNAFTEAFITDEYTLASTAEYYFALDYQSLDIEALTDVHQALMDTQEWFASKGSGSSRIPMIELLKGYGQREEQLRTMLLVLQIPILLMLAFYTFMISQLILQHERNEIAVLRSRGAKRSQIVLVYFLESAIIGAFAYVAGLSLGFWICKILGAANGFLEFVSRTALNISVNTNAVFYGIITVIFSMITMTLPAISYSKTTIVEHKAEKNRSKTALWKKTGLDFILLGISGYGYYAYNMRMIAMKVTGMDANAVPVDPLLFLMSTLFIIGAGLLFVRIFPFVVRFIYFLGKKIWSPVLYASFLQVARSSGREQFIMLFLVMTLSVGLFSANAARTLNTNTQERISYGAGADITIIPTWASDTVVTDEEEGSIETYSSGTIGYQNSRVITYLEPPFDPYLTLDGVESASKVFVKEKATAYIGVSGLSNSASAKVMGIEPAQFGKTAFMPPELLGAHWYEYLNLMTLDHAAALLSKDAAEKHGIQPGDTIRITWASQTPLDLRVYALVEYWPAFNPLTDTSLLVVCNLDYLQAKMAVEPYQVWLKKAEGTTSQQVYESVLDKKIQITSLYDADQALVSVKNDPLLQGVNGALTMGFIVTMIVCAIGFLIYWILSIKGRVLQFGILRAMGLSMGRMTGMLLTEQILISGTAIVFGMFTGALASQLFVPMLSVAYSAQELVPPFRVLMMRDDYIKLYAILGVTLSAAYIVLGSIISRIKMAQALKLGED